MDFSRTYSNSNGISEVLHFAFNIWDFESAKAVIDAAAAVNQDVILQISAGIYKRLPARPFADFVKSYSNFKGIHVWINIDHCKEKETLFSAIDNGWDMVMADGSSMEINQNISFTNEVLAYAHDHGVLVEAEIGQIKGIEDNIVVQQDAIASRKEIAQFLSSTDVDFIAVAFGNAHGKSKAKPNLHYDLVEYTVSITDKPFVVHGGSGLSDDVLKKLISINGVGKINISTDLKLAYKRGMEKVLENWSQPIEASEMLHDKVMGVAASKMRLISNK